jgi:hypothetical protein
MRLLTFLTLSAFSVFPFSAAQTNGTTACSLLVSKLGATIVVYSGPDYDQGASGSWNELNNQFRPSCVVFPRTDQDVQQTMQIIFTSEANYAVQSGGHAGLVGWNKYVWCNILRACC